MNAQLYRRITDHIWITFTIFLRIWRKRICVYPMANIWRKGFFPLLCCFYAVFWKGLVDTDML